MKSTNKDMYHSLFFWGTAKIYKFGIGVAAIDWQSVSEKKKKKIDKATDSIARKIKKKYGKNAILKGLNFEEGATAKERNQQIGGHKA